ncbi:MAG: hypothetical protein WCT32_01535 [Patescibacteria group bacterium]|jgi:hypothetical protein
MRKIFAALFFFLLLFNSLILILALDLKASFLSPQKLKGIALKSNAYEFTAASMRETFSKEVDMKAGDGVFVEVLSESITPDVIRQLSEGAIDQFFQVIDNPSADSSIMISFTSINSTVQEKFNSKTGLSLAEVGYDGVFGGEKKTVLGNGLVIRLLSNINLLIIIEFLIVVLSTLSLFLLSGKTASKRFSWVGIDIFFVGLILLGLTLFVYLVLPNFLSSKIGVWGITDQKLLIGLDKIIHIIFEELKILLIAETVLTLLAGVLLFKLGRGVREERVGLLLNQSK